MYMEESGETECSKTTNPSQKDEDEDESEVKNGKDGGSSSNSTVEESGKKSAVRPYIRSKMPRLRWTPDLHMRFINAVERLGGHDRATPKLVLQLMNIKGLNIAHVKSHLQMHRSKRVDGPNQGMVDHRLFMEGVDQNIFNLSQLPLLPSFNQDHTSNFSLPRYGDASWNGHERRWMRNSTMVENTSNNMTRPGSYGTLGERMLSNHYYRPTNLDLSSRVLPTFNQTSTRRANEDSKNEHWLGQSRQNPIELNSSKLIQKSEQTNSPSLGQVTMTGFKRKASDFELDLNLSLGIESGNEEEQEGKLMEDDENLSLSLYTSPCSRKLIKKVKEDIISSDAENARGASTLDLTL